MLDERTRLAGCHMIRDAVERLVLEEGADTVKRFMREAIEDGRRDFKSRVRALLVPGRYRSRRLHRGATTPTSRSCRSARSATSSCTAPTRPWSTRTAAGRPTCAARRRGAGTPFNATPSAPAGDAVDPLHADADLQRQDQRRRLLRDRAASSPRARGPTSATRRAPRRSRGCRCSAPRSATCARSRARCSRAATSRRSSAPTPSRATSPRAAASTSTGRSRAS